MIVKFFPTRNGGGIGSVNYLLNDRIKQGTARVIKGNEIQTRALIKQLSFKQKTCMGVLSFTESASSINDDIKQKIMEDFERTLLGDYMKDRVNILWVEHSDKGRLELNFLIPKIDLVTSKSFNPYFAKHDQFNIDLWKRTINDEYGFTSPDDPSNERNIRIDKKNLKHYNNIADLDKVLKNLVAQGSIKNRLHMIELLENNGYTVSRQNKTGISIVLPNQKRPNRMKGGIYSAEFTDISKLSELGESESRRIQQYANRNTQAECEKNRAGIETNIRKRDERNKQKYKYTDENFEKRNNERNLHSDNNISNCHNNIESCNKNNIEVKNDNTEINKHITEFENGIRENSKTIEESNRAIELNNNEIERSNRAIINNKQSIDNRIGEFFENLHKKHTRILRESGTRNGDKLEKIMVEIGKFNESIQNHDKRISTTIDKISGIIRKISGTIERITKNIFNRNSKNKEINIYKRNKSNDLDMF